MWGHKFCIACRKVCHKKDMIHSNWWGFGEPHWVCKDCWELKYRRCECKLGWMERTPTMAQANADIIQSIREALPNKEALEVIIKEYCSPGFNIQISGLAQAIVDRLKNEK